MREDEGAGDARLRHRRRPWPIASVHDVFRTRVASLLSVFAVLAVLAGCGGGNSEPAAPTSSTPTAVSLEGLTADEVLAAARTAAQSATSVRVKGSISQEGQSIDVDLELSGVARGAGSVMLDGGRIDLVRVGNDIYFKADEKTLTDTVAAGDAAIVKLIAGRYVKATVDTPGFADFAGLLDFVEFTRGALTPDGPITRVAGKPVGGTPTVGLQQGAGTLYVADNGTPFPLRIESASDPGGVTMSDWNAKVAISPPAADDVINVAALGGGGSDPQGAPKNEP